MTSLNRPVTRRVMMCAGACVPAAALAACGGGDEPDEADTTADAGGDSGSTEQAPAGQADGVTTYDVPVADVPVGGAVVVTESRQSFVVAQPSEGEFAAFSAICTHAGGKVAVAEGTTLECPLHQSQFDATTGDALTGPATAALTEYETQTSGDTVTVVIADKGRS